MPTRRSCPLQGLRSKIRQTGALPPRQSHVPGCFPGLEPVDDIGQAGGGFAQVGGVDLTQIAQADHLGAGTGAGDQRLHLLGGQILGLVNDDVAVVEGAAAHEVHRTDLDPALQYVLGRAPRPAAALAGVAVAVRLTGEHFQVVHQRAHPRSHLFLFRAGQKTDVFADGHGFAGEDDFRIALFFQGQFQTGGEGQQGLAGAGRAGETDEVHVRVHEQVQGEVLLAVAGVDAPDLVAFVVEIVEKLQFRDLSIDFKHLGFEGTFALQIDAFVGV